MRHANFSTKDSTWVELLWPILILSLWESARAPNIIQSHNSVMSDWQYYAEYSSHSELTILCRIFLTHDKTRSCWFLLFYHVWGLVWIEIHWNSRAWSHTASRYTWGSVTTLHGCRGVLGPPLDDFFWALIISWSRLLAQLWSGP
jgi:hypothetical protein